MPSAGFAHAILVIKRPLTYALDGTATGKAHECVPCEAHRMWLYVEFRFAANILTCKYIYPNCYQDFQPFFFLYHTTVFPKMIFEDFLNSGTFFVNQWTSQCYYRSHTARNFLLVPCLQTLGISTKKISLSLYINTVWFTVY
jgi:hypothetical protein